jgi:hypothetical protein
MDSYPEVSNVDNNWVVKLHSAGSELYNYHDGGSVNPFKSKFTTKQQNDRSHTSHQSAGLAQTVTKDFRKAYMRGADRLNQTSTNTLDTTPLSNNKWDYRAKFKEIESDLS